MILRILTSDQTLIHELLDINTEKSSEKKLSYNDFSITPLLEYQPSHGMVSVPEILEFAIEISTNIGIGLFTAWIYDLMKKRNVKAEISGKELPQSEKEIETIIQLTIREKR